MSLAERQKILQQQARTLARPMAQLVQDPRAVERPTDVIFGTTTVMRVNLRIALLDAPTELLYKARDQINELINARGKNGGKS